MKAEVKAGILRAAVAEAAEYTTSRSPMTALQKVLIVVDLDGGLTVSATDGQRYYFERRIPLVPGMPFAPGRGLYDPARLSLLLGTLHKDEEVYLSVEDGQSCVRFGMQSHGGSQKFAAESPGMFPDPTRPDAESVPPIALAGKLFAFAARRVGSIVDAKGNQATTGSLVSFAPGSSPGQPGALKFVGIGGNLLMFMEVAAKGEAALPAKTSVVVPGKALIQAAKAFDEAEQVEVQFNQPYSSLNASSGWVRSADKRLRLSLVEGRFPGVAEDDPASPVAGTIAVKVGAIRHAANQAEIAVDEEGESLAILLSVEGREATFTANLSRPRESVVGFELESEAPADLVPFWVQPRVIEGAVRHLEADDVVRIDLPKDPQRAIGFRGDGWRCWVMPVARPAYLDDAPEAPKPKPAAKTRAKAGAGR